VNATRIEHCRDGCGVAGYETPSGDGGE